MSGAGGAAQRAGAAIGHAARSAADAISGTWFSIPLAVRQRIAAAAALLAAVALVIFVLVPLAPCSVPGRRSLPARTTMRSRSFPADAGAYVHLNVDPDTDQYESARR